MKNKLVIIDGNSLLYRSFYALPLLTAGDGLYSSAIYGFANTIIKISNDIKPTHIVVAFDYSKHTFRNELFADYKGTRKPMPEELKCQLEPVKQMLNLMNITYIEKQGYEADDIIGTLSRMFADTDVIIVTGDRDSFQLISDNVKVYFNVRGMTDVKIMDLNKMQQEYGMTPFEFITLKALQGDNSDNIPGVKGIGPKSAIELVHKYKTLDQIYDNLNNESAGIVSKLKEQKEMAYLSYELSKINCEVDIDCKLENLIFKFPFTNEVKQFFAKYKFTSLLKKDDLFSIEDKQNISIKDVVFEKVDTKEKLQNCIKNIEKHGIFAVFHSENGFVYLATLEKEWQISAERNLLSDCLIDEYYMLIKHVMEDENIRKIMFDSKALRHEFFDNNIQIVGKFEDLSIMHNLAFGKPVKSVEDLCDMVECDVIYHPAFALLKVFDKTKNKLDQLGLTSLYYDVELKLSQVLFDMELCGFKVDKEKLDELGNKYEQEAALLIDKIYELAGEQFNINSSKQIAAILYQKLNLHHGKKMSTSAENLEEISESHPIVPLILRYRKVAKFNSTYIIGLKTHIDKNGFVHTTFKQTLTATGRLSSVEPNLQNIPVRSEESREIRSIYTASDSGHVLIDADYSQIELRLLAHFSDDEYFIDAFKNEQDIHSQTACQVFGVTKENVTPQMRRVAKVVNFGIVYGISDFGLANDLKIGPKQAKVFIDNFYSSHPKVREFLDKTVQDAKKTGIVKTLLGRMRSVEEINSPNFMTRKSMERAVQNMPLQGSAADIIKLAMIKIYDALKVGKYKAKLIMQIHDELIVDCPENEVNAVKQIIKESMNTAYQLKVPLTCDVTSSYRWSDGH